MRYVNLDRVLLHPDADRAIAASNEALKRICNETDPDERARLMKASQPKWTAFREIFTDMFGTTCWYTESENLGSDDDIDHFRPKGRVAESQTHGGYWWQSLDWRNFRLSSHRANRIRINPDVDEPFGKGDHFPIVDEAERWLDIHQTCVEEPLILDPTDPADPPLLTFDADGLVAISPRAAADPVAVERVEMSRTYLHLDWPGFKRQRRALYARILLTVERGDRLERMIDSGDRGAKPLMKSVSRELIGMTETGQPYSRASAAYVRHFRDRSWIKKNVLPHIPGVDE